MIQSRWKTYLIICILAAPFLCIAAPISPPILPPDGTELGMQFRQFTDIKEKNVQKAEKLKKIEPDPRIIEFFNAVRSNQWAHTEDLFVELKYGKRRDKNNELITI